MAACSDRINKGEELSTFNSCPSYLLVLGKFSVSVPAMTRMMHLDWTSISTYGCCLNSEVLLRTQETTISTLKVGLPIRWGNCLSRKKWEEIREDDPRIRDSMKGKSIAASWEWILALIRQSRGNCREVQFALLELEFGATRLTLCIRSCDFTRLGRYLIKSHQLKQNSSRQLLFGSLPVDSGS